MIYPRMHPMFSYKIPLPESMGSVLRVEAIDESVELHGDSDVPPMVFKEYRDVTPKNYDGKMEEMHTYIPVSSVSSSYGGINVYKAAWIRTRITNKPGSFRKTYTNACEKFVTLKVSDNNEESISELKEQVERVRRTLGPRRSEEEFGVMDRLLPVESCFMDEESGKFCAVIFSSIHGSLRSIMRNGFPHGFRHDLIPVAIKEILNALRFLHRKHVLHGDINAGHAYLFHPMHHNVFYTSKNREGYDIDTFHPILHHRSVNSISQISLGFAATVYDEDEDENEEMEPYLPMASMSKWAAAPEVYSGTHPYSEKADVWLVGITALELAYGGLKFASRYALEALIKEILHKKRLPDKTWVNPETIIDEEIVKKAAADMANMAAAAGTTRVKSVPTSKWKFFGTSTSDDDEDDDDNPFSETFTSMVMECLAWDPKKRPSVDKLLSHKFFKKGCKSDKYFYEAVVKDQSEYTSVAACVIS